jgi:hypothetical protein
MTDTVLDDLAVALQPLGMRLRGGFSPVTPEDAVPEAGPGRPARTLLLVGNVGPAMYDPFFAATESTSPINPLDSWTRREIEPIAARFDALALFPFGGPPWHPFQRWAKRAEGLQASPLGVLIHPEYGLWHAYRAALLFDRAIALPPKPPTATHPCDTCASKPCLSTCPVGAITPAGYGVEACARHTVGPEGAECRFGGCLARRACPVGRDYLYPPRAMAFHMAAFLKGHAPRD